MRLDRYTLTPTPENLRFDRAAFDRRLEEKRARVLAAGGKVSDRESVRPKRPSIEQMQRARGLLATHLVGTDAALVQHERAALETALRQIADLPSLGKKERAQDRNSCRTPERQAQVEQTRMWAGCGLLPPHIRKRLTTGKAAILSRILDIAKNSARGCCDWAVDTIARSVGQCRRQVQRVMAMIEAGEFPGIAIRRPVNRGPEMTDTNVVTVEGTKEGKRLSKWALRNQWSGRLFDLPKEIMSISKGRFSLP